MKIKRRLVVAALDKEKQLYILSHFLFSDTIKKRMIDEAND